MKLMNYYLKKLSCKNSNWLHKARLKFVQPAEMMLAITMTVPALIGNILILNRTFVKLFLSQAFSSICLPLTNGVFHTQI